MLLMLLSAEESTCINVIVVVSYVCAGCLVLTILLKYERSQATVSNPVHTYFMAWNYNCGLFRLHM